MQMVLGFEAELEFVTDESIDIQSPKAEVAAASATAVEEKIIQKTVNYDYEYTFDTFIVGGSNKFAHAACVAVASNPAIAYNPLYIYGRSGLGKTHLLYAIRHQVLKQHPDFNVVYLKGDDFTNELIDAIRSSKTSEFRNKYRKVDVLLMDDIQFIAGKDSTQEEFFHTFNTLYEAKKQIVLTSDRPPKEIQTLEDRIRTRFEWGLIADIQPPDFETRIAIIKRKAEILAINIPPDVVEFTAVKLKNNIRQLEGAVKKMKAYSVLTGESPSLAIAQTAIRDTLSENVPIPITISRIIAEVSKYYNIPSEDILGNKRTAEIALARQVSMYIARDVTDMSLPYIGDEFGGKDHTTVLHAIRKVEDNMQKDGFFKSVVLDLIKNVREH
jgi:chromosomal replication initiator protein